MREPVGGSVLEATLERITFANPETGYTVARVDAELAKKRAKQASRSVLVVAQRLVSRT